MTAPPPGRFAAKPNRRRRPRPRGRSTVPGPSRAATGPPSVAGGSGRRSGPGPRRGCPARSRTSTRTPPSAHESDLGRGSVLPESNSMSMRLETARSSRVSRPRTATGASSATSRTTSRPVRRRARDAARSAISARSASTSCSSPRRCRQFDEFARAVQPALAGEVVEDLHAGRRGGSVARRSELMTSVPGHAGERRPQFVPGVLDQPPPGPAPGSGIAVEQTDRRFP